MIEMMDWHKLELNHRGHYKDLLREAARERLALAGRDPNRHLFCQVLSWLGHRLVAWGQWLQKHFSTDHPVEPFPVVDQAR